MNYCNPLLKERERFLEAEWHYRYEERLGILAEDREPTKSQMAIAKREADEAIEILKYSEDPHAA